MDSIKIGSTKVSLEDEKKTSNKSLRGKYDANRYEGVTDSLLETTNGTMIEYAKINRKKRTALSIVRYLWAGIEAMLNQGYSIHEINKVLIENSINIKETTFRIYVSTIKGEKTVKEKIQAIYQNKQATK